MKIFQEEQIAASYIFALIYRFRRKTENIKSEENGFDRP